MSGKIGKSIIALLLVSCLGFILSCAEPSEIEYGKPGKGMGAFTLQIGTTESSGRTIMPNLGGGEDFAYYKLVFTGTGATPNATVTIKRAGKDVGEPIDLRTGGYDLEVFGYTSEDNLDDDAYAAKGTLTGINVAAGQVVTGTVNLTNIDFLTGEGIFSWDLEFSDATTKVTMEIISIDADDVVEFELFKTPTAAQEGYSGSIELDSGFYRVVLTFVGNPETQNEVIWRETLHVYKNMESVWTKEFDDSYFNRAIFAVTYNRNYTGSAVPIPESYFYDDFVEEEAVPPSPTRGAHYTFAGWYEDTTTLVIWDYENVALTADIEVFAKWTPPTDPEIELVFQYGGETIDEDGELDFGSVQLKNLGVAKTISIKNITTEIDTIGTETWDASDVVVNIAPSGVFTVGTLSATTIAAPQAEAEGGSVTFTLTPVSTLTAGDDLDATITVTFKNYDGVAQTAITLDVTGEVIADIPPGLEYRETNAATSALVAAAAFGNVYNQPSSIEAATKTVYLHSTSITDVEEITINLAGTDAAKFALSGDLLDAIAALPAGETFTLEGRASEGFVVSLKTTETFTSGTTYNASVAVTFKDGTIAALPVSVTMVAPPPQDVQDMMGIFGTHASYATASGVTTVTLNEDFTLNTGVGFTVGNNIILDLGGNELTVSGTVNLTVNGKIECDAGGSITFANGGVFNAATDATYSNLAGDTLTFKQGSTFNVSVAGAPAFTWIGTTPAANLVLGAGGEVTAQAKDPGPGFVITQTAGLASFGMANSTGTKTLHPGVDFIVGEDATLTIPNGTTVVVSGGASIEIEGTITIEGTLNVNASGSAELKGGATFTGNHPTGAGTITPTSWYPEMAELVTILGATNVTTAGNTITLTTSVALEANLTIPDHLVLALGNNTLTVPADKKLTIQKGSRITCEGSGSVVVNGEVELHTADFREMGGDTVVINAGSVFTFVHEATGTPVTWIGNDTTGTNANIQLKTGNITMKFEDHLVTATLNGTAETHAGAPAVIVQDGVEITVPTYNAIDSFLTFVVPSGSALQINNRLLIRGPSPEGAPGGVLTIAGTVTTKKPAGLLAVMAGGTYTKSVVFDADVSTEKGNVLENYYFNPDGTGGGGDIPAGSAIAEIPAANIVVGETTIVISGVTLATPATLQTIEYRYGTTIAADAGWNELTGNTITLSGLEEDTNYVIEIRSKATSGAYTAGAATSITRRTLVETFLVIVMPTFEDLASGKLPGLAATYNVGNILSVEYEGDFTTLQWYVNGVLITGTSGNTLTLPAFVRVNRGNNTLTARVEVEGKIYNLSATFRVLE